MDYPKALAVALQVTGLAMLAACAGTTTTTLPDGTVAYEIPCDRASGGMNYCFERAGKSCGAEGYTIVDEEGQVLSTGTVAEAESAGRIASYLTDQESILVKCGD